MDIYAAIAKDHRIAEALFERIMSATSKLEYKQRFNELKHELLAHAFAEDATFHEALRQNQATVIDVQQLTRQHEEMNRLLFELDQPAGFGGKSWMAKLAELRATVMRHAQKEESEIFKEARNILSAEKAERLAAAMDAMKYQQTLKMAA